MINFDILVREARKRLALSQAKLAAALHSSDTQLAKWEKGDATPSEERQEEVMSIIAKLEELQAQMLGAPATPPAAPAQANDVTFAPENPPPSPATTDPTPAPPGITTSDAPPPRPEENTAKPSAPEEPKPKFPATWPNSWEIKPQ